MYIYIYIYNTSYYTIDPVFFVIHKPLFSTSILKPGEGFDIQQERVLVGLNDVWNY
jgi:hypothetical protein